MDAKVSSVCISAYLVVICRLRFIGSRVVKLERFTPSLVIGLLICLLLIVTEYTKSQTMQPFQTHLMQEGISWMAVIAQSHLFLFLFIFS